MVYYLVVQFLINYTGADNEDKRKYVFITLYEHCNGAITKAELLKMLKVDHMASHDAEVYCKAADPIIAQVREGGREGRAGRLYCDCLFHCLHIYYT